MRTWGNFEVIVVTEVALKPQRLFLWEISASLALVTRLPIPKATSSHVTVPSHVTPAGSLWYISERSDRSGGPIILVFFGLVRNAPLADPDISSSFMESFMRIVMSVELRLPGDPPAPEPPFENYSTAGDHLKMIGVSPNFYL